MKTIFKFSMVLCCFIYFILLPSCDEDSIIEPSCDDVVCLNGGACQEGICICPNGFAGQNCECEVLSCQNGVSFDEENCQCDCASTECTGELCENCPQYESFLPANLIKLCPDHVQGDKEFGGNGPMMSAQVILYFSNANREVWVSVYFKARETQSDWTTAEKTWTFKAWTAPAGYKILSIESPISDSISQFIDIDTQPDVFAREGLLNKLILFGDTEGNDVGSCSDNDAYISVFFNTVTVKIIKV